MKSFTTLFIVYAMGLSHAFSQWTSSGPAGGVVFCGVQIGNGIYIGTPAGIYRSLDSGNTFKLQSSNMPGSYVRYLFYDSTAIYAGFDDARGIYISTDTCKTWTLTSSAMGTTFYLNDKSFVMTGRNVFCSHSEGTYYTTNHGKSWKVLTLPANMNTIAVPLFYIGNTLYRQARILGTYALYRSFDEGSNWTLADSGLNGKELVGIIGQGNTIFAFTREMVFTSINGGKTWKPMTNGPFKLPSGNNFQCNQICYNGRMFFGAQNTGNWPAVCSIEPGDTQWMLTKGYPIGMYPYTLFNMGQRVFMGSYQNMFVTNDDGNKWETMNPGMGTISISSLLVEGNHVIGASNLFIYRSDNSGASWKKDAVQLTFYPGCLHYFKNTVFAGDYGVSKGIFRSSDFGNYWDTTGLNSGAIYIMANDGTNLFAGGNVSQNSSAYKSTDGGSTWNYFHSGWPAGTPNDMLVKGNYVFATVAQSNILPSVFRSPTSAANWIARTNGLPNSSSFSLAVMGNTLYTGTSNFGVFKSTDDGENWTAENVGIETSRVFSIAVSGTSLFAATDQGVFVLYNGSGQWVSINYNLPAKQIAKLAVNNQYLYAAAYNASVWQIPLKTVGLHKAENKTMGFEVFPNPVNDQLAVRSLQLAIGDKIKIMDVSGKLIQEKIINEANDTIEISTLNLVEGIYFVQVIKDGSSVTAKFVVMH